MGKIFKGLYWVRRDSELLRSIVYWAMYIVMMVGLFIVVSWVVSWVLS